MTARAQLRSALCLKTRSSCWGLKGNPRPRAVPPYKDSFLTLAWEASLQIEVQDSESGENGICLRFTRHLRVKKRKKTARCESARIKLSAKHPAKCEAGTRLEDLPSIEQASKKMKKKQITKDS